MIGEALLMSYGFNTQFSLAGLASRQASAQGVVLHADWQVSVRVTPTKISPNSGRCFLLSAKIVPLYDLDSRETLPINPGQWDSCRGVN